MNVPQNPNGGLTLVPMPGFTVIAGQLVSIIEHKGKSDGEKLTPVDIATPEFGLRPSLECYPMLSKHHIGGHDCYVICSGPGTNDRIMRLIYTVGYLAARHASRITIVMGYFMHGRSDKDEGKKELAIPPFIVMALDGVAQGKLSRIICADPHSLQVTMADKPGHITPIFLTEKILGNILDDAQKAGHRKVCIAFPDDSACKRYEPAIKAIEEKRAIRLDVVVAWARRTSDKQKRISHIVGDTHALHDSLVASFDDETATGGSQINAAQRFKDEFGASDVWAAVTHGVLCGDAPKLFTADDCPISRLYVTDTIPVHVRDDLKLLIESGRLHVISWVKDLGLVIYDDHWNQSIRGRRY